jgi:hypothetical protein
LIPHPVPVGLEAAISSIPVITNHNNKLEVHTTRQPKCNQLYDTTEQYADQIWCLTDLQQLSNLNKQNNSTEF